jgi:hypothetical protein
MKGMVFTEFLEMVEAQLGPSLVDRIIAAAELPNDGAYTSIGTYDHRELVRLVAALSELTGTPAPALVRGFGEHLLQRFSQAYPQFFAEAHDSFDFLGRIDDHIHVEVRKLYPDAELPRFRFERPNGDELILHYSSPRGFGDLAEGLIQGCIAHYAERIRLNRDDLVPAGAEQQVRFHLVRLDR